VLPRQFPVRITVYILVRLVALLWVLALANLASSLGAYAISLLILASELLLGYAWGKAESQITACKPSSLEPHRLFVLIVVTAIIESIGAYLLIAVYAPWLILWRCLTAYIPFIAAEVLTFKKLCRIR
jgi:hypothetical protein